MGEKNMDREVPYKVWFGRRFTSVRELERPYIYVSPVGDGWNDFGFKPHSRVSISNAAGLNYSGNLKLGFLGEDQDLTSVFRKRDIDTDEPISATELPEFFTMLPELADYREVVRSFGVADTRNALEAAHDLVAMHHYKMAPSWTKDALGSQVFTLAFMRLSESFYAFHNAGPILDGLREETLTGISDFLELEFKLEAFSNKHNLKLQFDPEGIIPGRVCVLIGKNGLGKSQALSKLVQQLMRDSEETEQNSTSPIKLVSRGGRRPLINRLLAVGTPGETANTFPAETGGRSRVLYRRISLTRGTRKLPSRGFGSLITQLVRSSESIADRSRWSLFLDAVESNLASEEIAVSVRLNENSESNASTVRRGRSAYVPLRTLSRTGEQASLELLGAIEEQGDPVRILGDKAVPLSSGQLAFLHFAAQACLFIENGTLVLIDEPETHLHPNLIADFIELLDRLLQLTGSVAIVATHSAYFVREVRRSQVLVFRELEDRIAIDTPRLKTFGADVGSISFFVFEDDVVNRLVKKVKDALDHAENPGKLLDELKDQLSSEVLMSIKREMQI